MLNRIKLRRPVIPRYQRYVPRRTYRTYTYRTYRTVPRQPNDSVHPAHSTGLSRPPTRIPHPVVTHTSPIHEALLSVNTPRPKNAPTLKGRPPPLPLPTHIVSLAFGLWYAVCGVWDQQNASPLIQGLCKGSQESPRPLCRAGVRRLAGERLLGKVR